jgi:hypothetical protein
MRKTFFALAAGSLFLALTATAVAKVESMEKISLGTHWYGPERTLEGLKGHIVLWENWGYN